MLWQEGPGYKSTERGCRWEADVGMLQGLLQRLRPTFWDEGLFSCRMLMGRTVPRHCGSPSCHPRLLTLPLRTKSSFPCILASLEDMSALPALSSAPAAAAASPCLFMSLASLTLSLSQTFCLPPPNSLPPPSLVLAASQGFCPYPPCLDTSANQLESLG